MKTQTQKSKMGVGSWKILIILAAIFLLPSSIPAANSYPFVYYGLNSDGSPLTNKITISGSITAPIVGVGSNIVVSFARDYQPDTNGYASNSLAPGNYRLYVEGVSHSVTFGFVSNSAPQNLAQVAGFPVIQFLNFTLAQFSDAGSAAYMPSNNWALRTTAAIDALKPGIVTNLAGIDAYKPGLVTNLAGIDAYKPGLVTNLAGIDAYKPGIITNTAGIDAAKPGLVTNNATFVSSAGYQPATNTPATNILIYISGITTFTNASGAVTNITYTFGTNTLHFQQR
jgi:hypothetical protein